MKTVLNSTRLLNLALRTREVIEAEIPGDIIECGVGGSALVLAKELLNTKRNLWLYDTFKGLPEPGTKDGPRAPQYVGCNAVTAEEVAESITNMGFSPGNLLCVEGLFYESFYWQPQPQTIALLHIDADWYESVHLCLNHWYHQVSIGGIIILDDFGYWPGCRQAFYEFVHTFDIRPMLNRCNEAAWWIKGEGEE